MISRRFATDSISLAIGSIVNGLAVYVLVALGTRTYGNEAFAPVSVLWTFWALSAAVLTFPIQHWVIRAIRVDGNDARVRTTLPQLSLAVVAVCVVLFAVAFGLRVRLFGTGALWWPALVPAVALGSAIIGFGRGVLASRDRFPATAAALAGENLVRLALGWIAVVAGASVESFGAVLAGGALVMVVWPSSFRLSRLGGRPHRIAEFLAGLGGGVLLAQIALTAPPAVIAGLGGAAATVTGAFTALALFRVPYLIALGFATRLTAPLTGLVIGGEQRQLARLRKALIVTTCALTPLSVAFAWFIGPWLIDFIFGSGISPSRGAVAAIAAGSALALGALGFVLILMARAATTHIVVSWSVGLLAAIAVLALWDGSPIDRVVTALVVTELVAFVALTWSETRLAARPATAS